MTKRRVHAQPRQRWTPEDDAAVRALYPDVPAAEVAEMLGRPLHSVYSRAHSLGVKKSAAFLASPASGRVTGGVRKYREWTAQDDAVMRERYPSQSAEELATVLGLPAHTVYKRAEALGLRKSVEWIAARARERSSRLEHGGRSTRFEPGRESPRKGVPLSIRHRAKLLETSFKPGQQSPTWQPIGTRRLKLGYWWVKVSDERGVSWTHNWRQLHRLTWEEAHGPVPEGHALAFINGDREDCRLENLECVTRADLAIRNMAKYPAELRRINHLRGRLTRAINKRARREK